MTHGRKSGRPKFKIGQRVRYKGNRRLRHTISERYWQPEDPGWRYKMSPTDLRGMRKDIAGCWAVVESELEPISTPRKPAKGAGK